MKKILLTLAVALSGYCVYAQTNTFPSSANVGIGTTSPISDLQVSGLTILSNPGGANYNENLRLPPSNAGYSSIALGATSGTSGSGDGQWSFVRYPSSNNYLFGIRYYNTDYFNILNNGNVGIGTTSPSLPLQIAGSSGFRLRVGDNGSYYTDVSGNQIASFNNGSAADLYLNASSSGNVLLATGGGNIAIGTTDPHGYKLAVDGSAIATSMTVKLYAEWPDYVFKKNYKLPSLLQVKTYIDKNRHLPEMPSEQEVKDNGINLGEIVKIQTKKIEELTLYVIEQQKQIEQLKKEEEAHISALETKLAKLETGK